MRFVTHKLGFLIISAMVASVVSIALMVTPQGITLVSLNDLTNGQTLVAANSDE